MITRNDPCPCGSGKKYKRCCGLTAGQNRNKPDSFTTNRALAYSGAIGERREAFCKDYTAFKKVKIIEIESALKQETASAEKTISCSHGCAHCCRQFVVASLQECECITYHLYHHDSALEHFVRAFDGWRDRIIKVGGCFQKLNSLSETISLGLATDADRRLFIEESRVYAGRDIPCPFLVGGACSIYEVRPYICAGFVSVSPPEWCRALHPRNGEALHFKVAMPWDREMPYFALPGGESVLSSLPFLVYRILEEGYDALSSIIGSENLK